MWPAAVSEHPTVEIKIPMGATRNNACALMHWHYSQFNAFMAVSAAEGRTEIAKLTGTPDYVLAVVRQAVLLHEATPSASAASTSIAPPSKQKVTDVSMRSWADQMYDFAFTACNAKIVDLEARNAIGPVAPDVTSHKPQELLKQTVTSIFHTMMDKAMGTSDTPIDHDTQLPSLTTNDLKVFFDESVGSSELFRLVESKKIPPDTMQAPDFPADLPTENQWDKGAGSHQDYSKSKKWPSEYKKRNEPWKNQNQNWKDGSEGPSKKSNWYK